MSRFSKFISTVALIVMLGVGFPVEAQTASNDSAAFKTGQSVATTDTVNVRAQANLVGAVLGTQVTGAKGTVVSDAPVSSGGYTWYRINFQSGADGWVVSQYLRGVSVGVGIEIAGFYAIPNTVVTNGSTTIYWDVNGAEKCVLTSQVGNAAAKTLRSSANVKGAEFVKTLKETTKYKLSCTKGTTNKVEKTITVTVSDTPVVKPTSSTTAPRGSGEETFTRDQSVITLDVTKVHQGAASSSRVLGTQPKGKKGVVLADPAKEADGYRWYRVNFDGGVDGWVPAIFLSSVGIGVGPQINVFIATPNTIAPKEKVTFTWDAIGVSECTLYKNYGTADEYVSKKNAGITGVHRTSGITETTKFTLLCSKGGAQVEKTITVTVKAPTVGDNGKLKPVCDSFTASPNTITKGKSAVLNWQTTSANKVTITRPGGNVEAVAVDGSLEVKPEGTYAFLLTAVGAGGTTTCKATVTVVTPTVTKAEITSFTARPAFIISGSSTKLQWTSRGTDYCYIKDAAQKTIATDQKISGSFTVTPLLKDGTDPKFTYTLVCHDASTEKDVYVQAKTTVTLRQPTVRGASLSIDDRESVLADLHDQLSELLAKVSQLEKKQGEFAIGDPVVTTDDLKVRARGAGGVLGVQPAGASGVITSAWVNAAGRGWYQVDFATGVDGWVAASYLESGVVLDKVAINFSRHESTLPASTIIATEDTSETLIPLSYMMQVASEPEDISAVIEKLAVRFTITNAVFADVVDQVSLSINGADFYDVTLSTENNVTTALFDIAEPLVIESQNEAVVEVWVQFKNTLVELDQDFTIEASVTAAERDLTSLSLENTTVTMSGTAVGDTHTLIVTE